MVPGGVVEDESGFPVRLSAPARRALEQAGYTRLDQLDGVSEAALLALHGVGRKAVAQLRQALGDLGLALAEDRSGRSSGS